MQEQRHGVAGPFVRGRAAVRRARAAARRNRPARPTRNRLLSGAACLLAGLMIVVSAINARGTDLRPARNTELVDLVQQQAGHNKELQHRLAATRSEVEELTAAAAPHAETAQDRELAEEAGVSPVTGPSVEVTLTDTPIEVAPAGVDGDLLVVHQQDIQAVVNALWSGGAEAMTIQGQRVVSSTGIKCVGNTVVLHGVPYSPPYVIAAIGEPNRLQAALASSEYVRVYRQYVQVYGLGYAERSAGVLTFGPYEGSTQLSYARPVTR